VPARSVDPTWDDAPDGTYLGIPVADSRLVPVEGGGLLQDFDQTMPLLRDGCPPNALAELGRPLMVESSHEHPRRETLWAGTAGTDA
jgi:hypothetical protein